MPKSKDTLNENLLYLLTCTGIITILLLTSLNLNSYLHRKKQVLGIESDPNHELKFWQEIVNKNPTYRDAWLEIAKISSRVGETNLTTDALEKAKVIDPNSQKILELEKEIY